MAGGARVTFRIGKRGVEENVLAELLAGRKRHDIRGQLADAYKKGQVDYLDGITVDFGDWWFNVRKSNTEPLLRLVLESKSRQLMDEKFTDLKKILGEPVHGH